MLNIGIRLFKHAVECTLKFMFRVESAGNYRYFYHGNRLKMIMFKGKSLIINFNIIHGNRALRVSRMNLIDGPLA